VSDPISWRFSSCSSRSRRSSGRGGWTVRDSFCGGHDRSRGRRGKYVPLILGILLRSGHGGPGKRPDRERGTKSFLTSPAVWAGVAAIPAALFVAIGPLTICRSRAGQPERRSETVMSRVGSVCVPAGDASIVNRPMPRTARPEWPPRRQTGGARDEDFVPRSRSGLLPAHRADRKKNPENQRNVLARSRETIMAPREWNRARSHPPRPGGAAEPRGARREAPGDWDRSRAAR